jgi:hypothetical protein
MDNFSGLLGAQKEKKKKKVCTREQEWAQITRDLACLRLVVAITGTQ